MSKDDDTTSKDTKDTSALQDAIRLALEAAEAANDAASEVSRLQSETSAAAARLDRFGARLRPVMIGLLAGASISIVLGGLVYFKTLAEMRRTSATQIEALAMFQETVTALNGQLDAVGAMSTRLDEIDTANATAFESIANDIAMQGEQIMTDVTGFSDTAGSLQAQIATTLGERIDAGTMATKETLQASISDLQLAMSKMLSAAVRAAPAAAAKPMATTAKPAPAPRRVAPKPKPRTTSKPKPKAAPAPNPFSYP